MNEGPERVGGGAAESDEKAGRLRGKRRPVDYELRPEGRVDGLAMKEKNGEEGREKAVGRPRSGTASPVDYGSISPQ